MRRRLVGAAVAAAMIFAAVPVASAQSASDFDVESVGAVCLQQTGDACLAAVQAYIAAIKAAGLDPVAVDNLIADLVVTLGQNASQLPPAIRQQVADVIVVAAAQMADPARAERVVAVANDVAAGVDISPTVVQSSPA